MRSGTRATAGATILAGALVAATPKTLSDSWDAAIVSVQITRVPPKE